MAEQFAFPQDGDFDDAEHFSSMIGASNVADYVETGMTFSVDYATPQVTVSTGKAFVMTTSDTAASTGDTILRTNRVAQIPETTLSLTDSDTNDIFLECNFGTDDSPVVNAYDSNQTNPSGDDDLLIGTIDTTNDTSTEKNREPDAAYENVDIYGALDANNTGGRVVLPVGTDKWAT